MLLTGSRERLLQMLGMVAPLLKWKRYGPGGWQWQQGSLTSAPHWQQGKIAANVGDGCPTAEVEAVWSRWLAVAAGKFDQCSSLAAGKDCCKW